MTRVAYTPECIQSGVFIDPADGAHERLDLLHDGLRDCYYIQGNHAVIDRFSEALDDAYELPHEIEAHGKTDARIVISDDDEGVEIIEEAFAELTGVAKTASPPEQTDDADAITDRNETSATFLSEPVILKYDAGADVYTLSAPLAVLPALAEKLNDLLPWLDLDIGDPAGDDHLTFSGRDGIALKDALASITDKRAAS